MVLMPRFSVDLMLTNPITITCATHSLWPFTLTPITRQTLITANTPWYVFVPLPVVEFCYFVYLTPCRFHCVQEIYPSAAFENLYKSNAPSVFAGVVAIAFAFIVLAYYCYDRIVETRNRQVVFAAAQSNAIVSSMFPSHLRDKLIGQANASTGGVPKRNLRALLSSGEADHDSNSAPLADLFLDTTVLFAGKLHFSLSRNTLTRKTLTLTSRTTFVSVITDIAG